VQTLSEEYPIKSSSNGVDYLSRSLIETLELAALPLRLIIIGSHDIDYDWKEGGEEWSAPWGGSAAQWSGTIFPRIREYLPASTILEIAPGFGRWTHYLRGHCERLHVVDPDPRCIEACRRRFADDSRPIYHVNDGHSLSMIPDRSIDFVFSFDSLVHVSRETVEAYLAQLRNKLNDDGVGFIHHSNLGQYIFPIAEKLPRRARALLIKARVLVRDHQRARDMTSELFRSLCEGRGLKCMCQELVNWRGRWLIDCFTTFTRAGSKWESACKILRNSHFMREAEMIRQQTLKGQKSYKVKKGEELQKLQGYNATVREVSSKRKAR
jgi:methyltransferase family protein